MLPSKSNQLKIAGTRFYEEINFQNGNHNYEAIFINDVVNWCHNTFTTWTLGQLLITFKVRCQETLINILEKTFMYKVFV
jgi:hypothetical protein